MKNVRHRNTTAKARVVSKEGQAFQRLQVALGVTVLVLLSAALWMA